MNFSSSRNTILAFSILSYCYNDGIRSKIPTTLFTYLAPLTRIAINPLLLCNSSTNCCCLLWINKYILLAPSATHSCFLINNLSKYYKKVKCVQGLKCSFKAELQGHFLLNLFWKLANNQITWKRPFLVSACFWLQLSQMSFTNDSLWNVKEIIGLPEALRRYTHQKDYGGHEVTLESST